MDDKKLIQMVDKDKIAEFPYHNIVSKTFFNSYKEEEIILEITITELAEGGYQIQNFLKIPGNFSGNYLWDEWTTSLEPLETWANTIDFKSNVN